MNRNRRRGRIKEYRHDFKTNLIKQNKIYFWDSEPTGSVRSGFKEILEL